MQLKSGFKTFDDFVQQGIIEYLDVNEENNGWYNYVKKNKIKQNKTTQHRIHL